MKKNLDQSGAALVTILIFTVIAITVTTGAIAVSIINTQGTTKLTLGENAYHIAEAGAENAVLRLLRDSTYVGETLTVGTGTATISVTGAGTKTITSVGTFNDFERTIQVIGTFSLDQFVISSWKEI